MASKNKIKKAKNSFCRHALKWGNLQLKRYAFFDATQRKKNKKVMFEEY